MPTVTIGGNTYDTYVDLPDCQDYLAANIEATDFMNASPDVQGQCIVSMTRTFDRQIWQGEKTDPNQLHAFPRAGLTYADGTPVDSSTVPQQVIDACCEGAGQLASGSNLMDVQSTFNSTKSLKAGSVEIVNFRTDEELSPRFPQSVQELIGLWLGGLSSQIPAGARSSGTCRKTIFNEDYDFSKGF